jgi:hypothetical protein
VGNARTRALHLALIALARVRAGDLEQAACLAVAARETSVRLHSGRVDARVDWLAKAFAPFAKVPRVAEALEQLADQGRLS